jgi:hypothetical protein
VITKYLESKGIYGEYIKVIKIDCYVTDKWDIEIYSYGKDTEFITEQELSNLIATNLKIEELKELFKDIDLFDLVGTRTIRWRYKGNSSTLKTIATYKLYTN